MYCTAAAAPAPAAATAPALTADAATVAVRTTAGPRARHVLLPPPIVAQHLLLQLSLCVPPPGHARAVCACPHQSSRSTCCYSCRCVYRRRATRAPCALLPPPVVAQHLLLLLLLCKPPPGHVFTISRAPGLRRGVRACVSSVAVRWCVQDGVLTIYIYNSSYCCVRDSCYCSCVQWEKRLVKKRKRKKENAPETREALPPKLLPVRPL
jgi:hypothetical protein